MFFEYGDAANVDSTPSCTTQAWHYGSDTRAPTHAHTHTHNFETCTSSLFKALASAVFLHGLDNLRQSGCDLSKWLGARILIRIAFQLLITRNRKEKSCTRVRNVTTCTIYIYIYTHTHTHPHTHTHTHTNTHTYKQTQTHKHTHIQTHKHTYKYTNTHTHTNTHTNTHTHTPTPTNKHTQTHTHIQTHINTGEGKWRENWRMEWVASTLHITSEHGKSSITTADAHTSAASSRLN
jgi:hypothetical protein